MFLEQSVPVAMGFPSPDNNKKIPVVSIIIMNYNYESFLLDAIESSLAQTYTHVEVIVVDDGSTDASKEVIERFGSKIISVFKENGGQASALNAGFEVCSGEYICLLDADDLYLPERVADVVSLFQLDDQVNWVFTESAPIETVNIVSGKLDLLFEKVRIIPADEKPQKIDFRESILLGKIPDFTPSTSNLCFSRRISEEIFPLPEIKGLSGMAITDLYIKTIAVGLNAGYVTKKNLGVYRFHNNYYKNLEFDKKRRMFGEIYTTTGYWMGKNFPKLNKISRKFLTKGFATYLSSRYAKHQRTDADCKWMLSDYLKRGSFRGRLETYLFIFYYRLRLQFKSFV